MYLNEETRNAISNYFERTLGITYEDLINMDPDDVQELIRVHKNNNQPHSNAYTRVMVGYGEHAIFVRAKKCEKVMIGYGNFTEAGLTYEESKKRLDNRIDDAIYGKPNTFSKRRKRNSRM